MSIMNLPETARTPKAVIEFNNGKVYCRRFKAAGFSCGSYKNYFQTLETGASAKLLKSGERGRTKGNDHDIDLIDDALSVWRTIGKPEVWTVVFGDDFITLDRKGHHQARLAIQFD